MSQVTNNDAGEQGSLLRLRANRVAAMLETAAEEMLEQGLIGVAARIDIPGLSRPVIVASGHQELNRSDKLAGTELFAIASQSKMFTAAAILLLIQDGIISLDDPVARYVPDVPAVDGKETIAQFLNHTSGIGNFIHALTTLPYPWPTMSYEDIMALARIQGKQYEPGAKFDYNNTDVVVLARLCEVVTGMPIERFLCDRIFNPLGMNETYIASGGDWPRNRMAKGYYLPAQGYDGPPLDVSTLKNYSIASAAGNIVSSLADMNRWGQCLLTPNNVLGLTLQDFTAAIAEAGTGNPGWFFPRRYGFGMESWLWGGRRFWGHRGSFFGYHSGTFIEMQSGITFSMFLTMCTAGSFMRFIDLQAYDYMQFMASCAQAAVDITELD